MLEPGRTCSVFSSLLIGKWALVLQQLSPSSLSLCVPDAHPFCPHSDIAEDARMQIEGGFTHTLLHWT